MSFDPAERPVFRPSFWRARLQNAAAEGLPWRALFNTDADTWAACEARHRAILAEHVRPDDGILDAGCAYGRLLDLLPPGWRGAYHGVDLAAAFIEKARADHPGRDFTVLDLRDLRDLPGVKVWDWGIAVSVKRVIAGHAGAACWAGIEAELRRLCKRLMFLDYDPNDQPEIVG